MKTWMIFAVGILVLVATLLLPTYQQWILPACALALLACVVAGFIMKPQRDVFYVRTSVLSSDIDGDVSQEHERIAVRLELVRLWMLFIPAFAGAAFFVVLGSQGRGWQIDLFGLEINTAVLYGLRGFEIFVVWVLSKWLRERWVLRNAEACSARSWRMDSGYVTYSFVLSDGSFYGGEAVPFQFRPREVVSLVLYDTKNPNTNLIVMSCVFHTLRVIGRGVTDLQEAKRLGFAHTKAVQAES